MNKLANFLGIALLSIHSYFSELIDKVRSIFYKQLCNYNMKHYKNKLISVDYIDLEDKKIQSYKVNKIVKNNYILPALNKKIQKANHNLFNILFMLNYCNDTGEIISYIITFKQYRLLCRDKAFIVCSKVDKLIDKMNSSSDDINILHSSVKDSEITNFTKKHRHSLLNITVSNLINYLHAKSALCHSIQNCDLIILDSDFLDEYIYRHDQIISLKKNI